MRRQHAEYARQGTHIMDESDRLQILNEAWWVSLKDGKLTEHERTLLKLLVSKLTKQNERDGMLDQVGEFVSRNYKEDRDNFLEAWKIKIPFIEAWKIPFLPRTVDLTKLASCFVWPFPGKRSDGTDDCFTSRQMQEMYGGVKKLKEPMT